MQIIYPLILFKQCPICSSFDLEGYSIDCKRNGPHMSRVICRNCGIVFANPMADARELDVFYSDYYQKEKLQQLNYTEKVVAFIQKVKTYPYEVLKKEARFLYDYKQGGRFLDVGCGLGIGLLYADRPEFDLYATEFDDHALTFVREQFHDVKTFHGELSDARYPDNYFDYVYCNHVIEHVLDPVAFMKEMHRVLKKDGFLYIGTPNRHSNLYGLYRSFKFLSFSVPQIIDGIEHTFIFSKKNLADLAVKQGFTVEMHRAITLGDSIKSILNTKINFKKKLSRYVQTLFKVNQELVCRKS